MIRRCAQLTIVGLAMVVGTVMVVAQETGGWWGREYRATGVLRSADARRLPQTTLERVRHWNDILMEANAVDHTPAAPGDPRIAGEQRGPGRTARAMAITHIAVFDAMIAIEGRFEPYLDQPPAPPGASVDAAIAQAAHDTLVALYPSRTTTFDAALADDLSTLPDHDGRMSGRRVGRRAADEILRRRANDRSNLPDPVLGIGFTPGNQPGEWRQDPISQIPIALGAFWGRVRPFVIPAAARFRVPPPPELTSDEYTEAFDEVKRLGGDGLTTSTQRTPDQTLAGIFWAYDGTPGLGTPPRLYNQIAMQLAEDRGLDAMKTERLLALVNIAMADAGIACWESKYHFDFWRPVTAVRESDPGTGPTGLGDGNENTVGDPTFTPLGAPASNLIGPNFTPPFPAYASGHATFGGALFQVLRRVFKTDDISFSFVSDELDGVTRDNTGAVRPRAPRSFNSLSDAEEENGQSRIYLGIHFAFDKTDGIQQGNRIADFVFRHVYRPDDRRR